MKTSSAFATTTGFKVPGASGVNLVKGMDPELVVAVLEPRTAPAAPQTPMMYLVNAAPMARAVKVEFDGSKVYGWSTVVGDARAGFQSCGKVVLGAEAKVDLQGGEGVLLSLTMFEEE